MGSMTSDAVITGPSCISRAPSETELCSGSSTGPIPGSGSLSIGVVKACGTTDPGAGEVTSTHVVKTCGTTDPGADGVTVAIVTGVGTRVGISSRCSMTHLAA